MAIGNNGAAPAEPPATQYAIALFGQRHTDWRTDRLTAIADAVAANLASWDDWHRPRFYLSVGATIITRQAKP